MPPLLPPPTQLVDQHGFPLGSSAELAEDIGRMGYAEAQEAIYLLQDQLASRQGMFADEDYDWSGLSFGGAAADRDAIDWNSVQKAARLAYKYWLHNPIIHQGVETTSEYVFGRGVNITSEDEEVRDRARELWGEPDMQKVITGGKGLKTLSSTAQVYGNLWLALQPKPAGEDRVHVIPMSTIIKAHVNEWMQPIAWLRSYIDPMQPDTPKYEWVKSLDYWKGREVMLPRDDEGQDYPINERFAMQHISLGSLVGPLGLPSFWSGIAWAKAYKESLEDFAVVQRALRVFAWRASGNSFDGVQNMRSAVKDGFQKANASAQGTGQVMMMPSADSNFQPIRTANYTTPADGSRRLLLMACAAFGLPETYFGDVSVGTYATAATMERPVELRMKAHQEMWGAELERMLSFLLDGTADNEKGIEVSFPSILEHEAGPFMQAVKTADALSYPVMDPKMLAMVALETLGFEDIEDKISQMEKDGLFDTTRQEGQLKLQQQYAPEPAPGSGAPGARDLGKDRQRPDRPKGAGMPRPDRS